MICPTCKGSGQVSDMPAPQIDTGILELLQVPQPAAGDFYIDPVFKTQVTRISDARAHNVPSIATEYPTVSPWNADGTRLLLIAHDHYLIINEDGSQVHTLIPASAEARWSPVDPDWLVFILGNELHALNVRTGGSLKDWPIKFQEYKEISSKGESDIAGDGLHLALVGDGRDIFIFNHESKKKTPIRNAGTRKFDSVMIVDKDSVLVSWDIGGIQLLDSRGYSWPVASSNGHKDLCHIDGRDCLIYTNSDEKPPVLPDFPNGMVRIDLKSGHQTGLLSLPWSLVIHVSCSDAGWACISTFPWPPESEWSPFASEIFLVHVVTGELRRIAHHRSLVRRLPNGKPDYTAEAKAVISRDGKRIVFSSNFGGEQVDVYSIELSS